MGAVTVDEDVHAMIERRLRQRLSGCVAGAEPYGEAFAQLWRLTCAHMLGGKLLRPRLLLELHRALVPGQTAEPDGSSVVLDLAVAVEMLHYAFLLHDDVIDGDLRRRRSPNLIAALRDEHPGADRQDGRALHWGRSSAILMGDLLLSEVHQRFAAAELAHETRTRALGLLHHTITETVAGEQKDVALSDGVVSGDLRTVLAMSAHKTATYTFELPLRLAAVLAHRHHDLDADLAAIGRHLGLAFQLQDDLLSVFGDQDRHGKDAYSDLREGKQTALIAYARMTSAWPAIDERFGAADLTVLDAEAIREDLRACGAEAFVRSLVEEQLSSVRILLADAEARGVLPASALRLLTALVDQLDGRRS